MSSVSKRTLEYSTRRVNEGNVDVIILHTLINIVHWNTYTVKKRFPSFPSPAGMSLPNSLWAGIMTS